MTATARVERFLAEVIDIDDPAVFISIGAAVQLRSWAAAIDDQPAANVPLRGLVFSVKDNIDVASMETTAGCPAYAYDPDRSSPVVQRLLDAGAVPVAKSNLDQFATGLVGTRSPYGAPRNPFDPHHVPGGSSSGAAVSVARGIVDFALGTDTAGSGRVPAAFCGVVGVKPTVGRLSTLGVVPAVRTLDCVSIFAPDLTVAAVVLDAASGFVEEDPYSREPSMVVTPAIEETQFGVVAAASLATLGASEATIDAYVEAVAQLPAGRRHEIDFTPFAAAGDLLYGGPWVAERTHAVGAFIAGHRDEVDPTVGAIIAGGESYSAVDVFDATNRLAGLRRQIDRAMHGLDVIVLPTTPHGATLAEVDADPVGVNSALGRFTTFANLVDLAAVSVPWPPSLPDVAGVPFGITLYSRAWCDEFLLAVAASLTGARAPARSSVGDATIPLVVAGAHLKGQPLEGQLTGLGAAWRETTKTAATYRLFALPGGPPEKPGVVFDSEGTSLEVDVWDVPPAGLGRFLTMVPAPLALGKITLDDGRELTGFVCEPRAMEGAIDVTSFGGWRRYVEQFDTSEEG